MNPFKIPIALLAGLALVFSCETPDQPEEKPEIKIPSESQAIFSSGIQFPESTGTSAQTATLTFTATDAWMADVVDTKASSWLSVQPSSGSAGDVNMTVTAQPNTGENPRSATVTIKCGTVSKSFTVTQAGIPPAPPADVPVESVKLSQTELSLTKGSSEVLTATVSPDNATDKTVTWSSSASDVVSVDQSGKVTALKNGKATITAKAGEKSATCAVTVTTPVESVSLDHNSITLEEGKSVTLVATISPNDADVQTVSWSTSDASVATVDNGKVTGVKEGSATITASAGGKSATCSVTVKRNVIAVESVTLNKTVLDFKKGESETLIATVKPDNATDKNVTWSSSDATIASVTQDGTVTALKSGIATVTASAGGKSATCTVTVTTPVESVSLDRNSVTLEEGQSTNLMVTISPNDADDKTVVWKTSDAAVATVTSGKVTAVKEGTATITATVGGKSATCAVTVTKNVVAVVSVTLNKTELTLAKGASETLVATVSPDNATDKKVTWSSGDATIASVDQNGKVTALKAGTTTVTAKAGEKSAVCRVTVTDNGGDNEPFAISPTSVEVEADGGTFKVTVTCSTTYHINSKPDWVTEDSVSGKVHTFSVPANTNTEDRSGVIVFCDDQGTCLPCNVKQKGKTNVPFSLSPTNVEVEAAGGTFKVTVTCSTTYHINSKPDWVTEESVSGKVHTFSVPANPTSAERSGVIVFCDDQGTCLPCNVKQKAGAAETLEVSAQSLSFAAEAGTRNFNITSNQSWTVTSNQSWCQVSPASGSNNGTITVTASANSSSDARNATITVAVPGKSLTKTVTVTQAGSGSQDSFDWSQTFYHRSLAMRFTATWCGWCPRMAKSMHLAMEQNPEKIEPLYLHGGGSDLDFSGTDALMTQYEVSGFPTGIIDGRRLVQNYEIPYTASLIGQYLKETEDNYPVSSAISYESSWSGQTLSVDVALYLRYAAKYKVTVVLLEDGIVNAQSDYEEGNHSDYVHDHIARMALSNISGDAFTISQNQTIKHFNYSVSVPSSYKKSNLRILVYVQREFGTQTVLQTSSSYGSYYVDNSASGVAGGSLAPTVAGQANGGNEGIGNGGDINM